MPPKNKKAKNKKTKGKEKAAPQARLGHGNELLRLGQTSGFATNKQAPHRFLQYLRSKGELNEVSISVRDVGSRVVLTPGVYARGPGLAPALEAAETGEGDDGPAIETEIRWRNGLCDAHRAVMSALDSSGVSRMLDVRPTYVCPVQTCHFHCYSRLELLEHFRNEHVTKKSLLQSVTATTAAVEGSISKLSTDSLRTLMGVTRLPTPDPLSALLEEEEGVGIDDAVIATPYIESLLKLSGDDNNTIVVSLPPPPDGIAGGSAEDTLFNEFLQWLFADWAFDSSEAPDENGGTAATTGPIGDHEDEFERWIGCNHRLIYHYDHYVTARENIFLPCTIRGVRLMKDGQKVSMVVPEVMRPMKPKHVKSTASWKLHREHPEVTLESHNDDTLDEDTFTFKCIKFKSYQGTGKMARSPPVKIGGVPWRLMVYPDGNSAQDQGEYTSVFLEVDKSYDTAQQPHWQCFVHFKLDILSSKIRYTYEKKAAHRFTSASMNWGFGQLMALPDVLDPAKGYLTPDGSVTFRATVRVVAGTDIEQWGGHTTYDSIVKTGMPGLPYWDGVDSPSCLRSLLQVLFYIPLVRRAVFGMQVLPSDPMARPLIGLQLVFYWLHMVTDPSCTDERKDALKQAGSQLKEIMQGCSGWDTLKKFPGWEPVTQNDLRLLIQVLLASIDEQLEGNEHDVATMGQLFRGTKMAYVKCLDVDEETCDEEGFCSIELNVKESPEGTKDLMTAFRELTKSSPINYMTKSHGDQMAEAGVIFTHFPPVLVIQLMRFEDHATQDGEKVKDRCEFPEHINLDEFLEEPESTPADYTLHAMLVHYDSKDQTSRSLYHGQHAAFIRPDPIKGEWFKFMDPFVKKAAATEDVLEEAFGESGEFCGQAYMLVYMRDDWCGELLQPVKEIPDTNLDRLPQLLEKSPWNVEAPPVPQLDDNWMEVDVIQQFDIETYENVDICTFKESPIGTLFRVEKTQTIQQLTDMIQDRFQIKVQPKLYQFIHRQNGSYRPDEYMNLAEVADKQIVECASSCSKFSQSKERWHLFMLTPSIETPSNKVGDDLFLLFFKMYSPNSGDDGRPTLRHLGHTLATFGETIESILPRAKQMVGAESLKDAELLCFEEVSNTLVEDVSAAKTCRQQELQNGDILVVCDSTHHDLQALDAFYSVLRNQVSIEFRELAKPHDHGFTILLDKNLSCQDVTLAVAEHLGLDDPLKLQFTTFAVPHDGVGVPGRTIPPPCSNQTLDDMRRFASRVSPCLCYKKSSQVLLFEVLEVPVTEQLLRLTRNRDAWLSVGTTTTPPQNNALDTDIAFGETENGAIRDLLKDMRQLSEAIRKDVRERIADIDREAANLRTRIRAIKEDRDFVKKQLAALDEAEQTSSVKRSNKDVRKRLQAAREQRDHVEQAKGTRSQFEKDMTGLLHNYQCQVSQIVAKEPLKCFLSEIEKDLDGVIAKILRLMWGDSADGTPQEYDHLRSGLSRAKFAELVSDQAFSKYFKWQADQMLHHAKMVKRKVAERVKIFLNVCSRARVDPLTQGIKAVFRYHLCGLAVQDLEDRQRNEQLKMDAEVDMVQRELLEAEEEEKKKKEAADEREKMKQKERMVKEMKRRDEEQRRALEEEERERAEAAERKRLEEEEARQREEDLRRRRVEEQEKQRREEESRYAAEQQAKKEEAEKKKAEAKKKREEERRKKQVEEERRKKEQEAAAAKAAKIAKEKEAAKAAAAAAAAEKEAKREAASKRKQQAAEARVAKGANNGQASTSLTSTKKDSEGNRRTQREAARNEKVASNVATRVDDASSKEVYNGADESVYGGSGRSVPDVHIASDGGASAAADVDRSGNVEAHNLASWAAIHDGGHGAARAQRQENGFPAPMPHGAAGNAHGSQSSSVQLSPQPQSQVPGPQNFAPNMGAAQPLLHVGPIMGAQPLHPQHGHVSALGQILETTNQGHKPQPQMMGGESIGQMWPYKAGGGQPPDRQAMWMMEQEMQYRGVSSQGSIPAQDAHELAMWAAIEGSQRAMAQGSQPHDHRGRPTFGMAGHPGGNLAPAGLAAGSLGSPSPGVPNPTHAPGPLSSPRGVDGFPVYVPSGSPPQPTVVDAPSEGGFELPTGLLDEDEGGDLWGAIRAEQEEFQNQLDLGTGLTNGFPSGGGSIW